MADQIPPAQKSWIALAHLLRPQGRKGELLADLLTDFPERFAEREGLRLRKPNGSIEPAVVEAHWLPLGKNAGRIVLKLQGIDSITAAQPLAGFDLVIPAAQRVPLNAEEGDQYIADLLDCTLVDKEHTIGAVEDVHFPTNVAGARLADAAPLLVVRSPTGDELLIPFAKAWIKTIDLPGKRIEMHLPEGLLDING